MSTEIRRIVRFEKSLIDKPLVNLTVDCDADDLDNLAKLGELISNAPTDSNLFAILPLWKDFAKKCDVTMETKIVSLKSSGGTIYRMFFSTTARIYQVLFDKFGKDRYLRITGLQNDGLL